MNKTLLIITPIAVLIGLALSLMVFRPTPIQLQAATWLGDQAKPLPPFALTDHFNRSLDNQSIAGRWHLWFFGYTHCPDICPDTLQVLANTLHSIQDQTILDRLQVTFITVDPDRDSLENMKTYVTYFDPRFVSARTTIEQLRPLTKTLGMFHAVHKSEDGHYEVEHSGALALVDPRGQFIGLFSGPHDSARIAHDLTALINGYS